MVRAKRLFRRSLLLQAGWNRELMQGLGFAYALLPLSESLSPEARAAFIRRHLGYVNTSPALSGILLGVVAAEEARLAAAAEPAEVARARVTSDKRRLEGPLAALGDRCFWGWLRPLLGVLGTFLLLTGASMAAPAGSPPPLVSGAPVAAWLGGWALASVLAALAFYNGLHLVIRWRSTRIGLAIGREPELELAEAEGGFGVGRLTRWLELIGPLIIGALAGRLLIFAARAGAATTDVGGGAAGVALVAAGVLIGVGAGRFRQPPERIGMAVLVLLLLAARVG
jgi:mannose/fructose/N-acetylgalactosamine-specific phosphotransferase system component IID